MHQLALILNREQKREEMLPAAIQLLNSELAEFDVIKVYNTFSSFICFCAVYM